MAPATARGNSGIHEHPGRRIDRVETRQLPSSGGSRRDAPQKTRMATMHARAQGGKDAGFRRELRRDMYESRATGSAEDAICGGPRIIGQISMALMYVGVHRWSHLVHAGWRATVSSQRGDVAMTHTSANRKAGEVAVSGPAAHFPPELCRPTTNRADAIRHDAYRRTRKNGRRIGRGVTYASRCFDGRNGFDGRTYSCC